MAGEHEVVGRGGAIPVWVFGCDHVDIVGDEAADGRVVERLGVVDVSDKLSHAEGKEEGVRSPGILRSHHSRRRAAPGIFFRTHHFQLRYETALCSVDVFARPTVHQRRLPFRIHVHFEALLHLHIAPVPQDTLLLLKC